MGRQAVDAFDPAAHADALAALELVGEAYRIGRLTPARDMLGRQARGESSIRGLGGAADRHAEVLELELPADFARLDERGRDEVLGRVWRALEAHQRAHHAGAPAELVLHGERGALSTMRDGKLSTEP